MEAFFNIKLPYAPGFDITKNLSKGGFI